MFGVGRFLFAWCSVSGLNANANNDGNVNANDTDNYNCNVNNDGSSNCNGEK